MIFSNLPASWLGGHKFANIPENVLVQQMEADGVRVVGEDTHQPLEEKCTALVLGELHRSPGQGQHDGLELVRLSGQVRETRLGEMRVNTNSSNRLFEASHLGNVGSMRVAGKSDQSVRICQGAGHPHLLLSAGKLQQELNSAAADFVERELGEVVQDHLMKLLQLG